MLKLIRTRRLTSSLFAIILLFNISFAGFCSRSQIASVRAALKAAPVLTNRLVGLGRITEGQAKGAVKDFTDGMEVALTLGESLDDADTLREKHSAASKAFQDWVAIYNRGNFGVHQDIRAAADIASGIFEFIEAYYGDKAGLTTHSDVGADGLSEREFKDALDQRIKELEKAFKGE